MTVLTNLVFGDAGYDDHGCLFDGEPLVMRRHVRSIACSLPSCELEIPPGPYVLWHDHGGRLLPDDGTFIRLHGWCAEELGDHFPQLLPDAAECRRRLERVDPLGGLRWYQAGRCAVCERRRELLVDHDHETGWVRGLLCVSCNTSEGSETRGDRPWFRAYRADPPAKQLDLWVRYGEHLPRAA